MAFDEPQVSILFPVPLVTVRLAQADALNAALLEEVAVRHEAEAGVDRSNRKGWHSAKDLFARPEPAHQQLCAELREVVRATTAKLAPEVAAAPIQLEGWINASPPGAYNSPHDHAGAFWSGCYYISVPTPTDPEDGHSGAIEFLDPRGSTGSLLPTPFTRPRYMLRPAAGTCLLWPGFLKHWVHPNASDALRVTAAFNGRLRKPGPTAP